MNLIPSELTTATMMNLDTCRRRRRERRFACPRNYSSQIFPNTNSMIMQFSSYATVLLVALCSFMSYLQPETKLFASAWLQISKPNLVYDYNATANSDLHSLWGNDTSSNFFRILGVDSTSLLLGGQNVLLNISLQTLHENNRLQWRSEEKVRDLCQKKGRHSNECYNFIRSAIKQQRPTTTDSSSSSTNDYMICGTNSFSPQCRAYTLENNEFVPKQQNHLTDGVGSVSHDPQHNSTQVVTNDDNGQQHVFSAVALDLSSLKPAIVRDGGQLRTPTYPPLNEPHFAGGFADDAFVYFGLRETAQEHTNCGKRVLPRLARVCRNDPGYRPQGKRGPYWTSFSKARLNCSVPGDYPFYFDELHALASSGPVSGQYLKGSHGARVLYGVFSTPENSLPGSAVCAFDMADIGSVFQYSRFKEQKDMLSNWLPINEDKVVTGVREALQCKYSNDSQPISENVGRFIESHPLMDKAVPALYGRPVLIYSQLDDSAVRFRSIDVLPQVLAADGRRYDVLYIGTHDGRVLKAVNTDNHGTVNGGSDDESSGWRSVVIEERRVMSQRVPVTSVRVVGAGGNERVVALADDELHSLPVQNCDDDGGGGDVGTATCGACVARQDPHCAWHVKMQKCLHYQKYATANDEEGVWIQDIRNGKRNNCSSIVVTVTPTTSTTTTTTTTTTPKSINRHDDDEKFNVNRSFGDVDDAENMVPDIKASQVLPVSGNLYREETLALAVVITLVLALTVGFLVGYQMNRWRTRCQQSHQNSKRGRDPTNLSLGSNLSDYAQYPSNLESSVCGGAATATFNPYATQCATPHLMYQAQQQQYNPYAIEPSSIPSKAKEQQAALVLNVNPTATIMRHSSSVGHHNNFQKILLNNNISAATAAATQAAAQQAMAAAAGQTATATTQSSSALTATLPRLNTLNKNLAALNSYKAYL